MEKGYVFPEIARKKLKTAEKLHSTTYIYGMSGFGKTSHIKNFFDESDYTYFDLFTSPHDLLGFTPKKKSVVVIDNLGFINDDQVRDRILDLIKDPAVRCILLSRSKCPEWLIRQSSFTGDLLVISQDDLRLSIDAAKQLLILNGISDPEGASLEAIRDYSSGYPLLICFIANRMLSQSLESGRPPVFDDSIAESARTLLGDYLNREVLEKWNDELVTFVTKVSIVPSFTIPLAVEITGISGVEALIDQAQKLGNFLSFQDGKYIIEKPFRRFLTARMYSVYSKERINELFFNAGNYYKRHKMILEAFDMFDKAGSKPQQLDILIENARLNPSDGFLLELKSAYFALDNDTILAHPELVAAMSMLYSLILDVDASDYWYAILQDQAETLEGKPQKTAKRYLTYLDIACIHKPGANVLSILKQMASTAFDKSVIVPEWALSCNGPTLMNGGRDFCEWSRTDTDLYKVISPICRLIFGKSGIGMSDLSLAESYLEKGKSDYEIMRLITKGQMEADMHGRVEMSFVAVGLLAQLHLVNGHIDDAISLLKNFKEKNPDVNPKLIMNIDTLLCRISLILGDNDAVLAWLKTAPDENAEFNVLYRYCYMCKIRCYLAENMLGPAYALLNRMMYYAKLCERTFITIECLILMSVFEKRSGMPEWDQTLCKALELAEDYHFIRLFTREAAAILDMLQNCSYRFKNSGYKKQLLDEVRMVAKMYPSYLQAEAVEQTDISGNALSILRLQAQGLSNDEIAKTLFISLNTVKYHCKENYRKLGVSSRTAAISEAGKRGLL